MGEPRMPTLEEQSRFWDSHWQHWQDRRVINAWSQRRFETILSILQSLHLHQPRIIDLGCGAGLFTERLAGYGDVTGIDLSAEAIAMAKSRSPHITYIAGNLLELPLPADHFDVAISQEVISHCENQVLYLDRAAHVLKPGGYLILTTDNEFVMERLEHDWFISPDHIADFLSMKELKRLLRRHFNVIHATTILPMGHSGILRFINSPKVNNFLELFISREDLAALKERLGFGLTIVALAQRDRG